MGFIVSFFNNILGFLKFKDIEEINEQSRSSFKVGQTLKVFIMGVNAEEKKIYLSLSNKGIIHNGFDLTKKSAFSINKVLESVPNFSELFSE
jgi:ribosomal protein S1